MEKEVKKSKKKAKVEEPKIEETKMEEIMEKTAEIIAEIEESKVEVKEECKVEEVKTLPFKRVQVDTLAEKKAEVARLKAEYEAAVKEEKEREEQERAEKAPLIERITQQLAKSKHDVEVAKNLVRIATESVNEIKAKIEAITGKPVAKMKKAS